MALRAAPRGLGPASAAATSVAKGPHVSRSLFAILLVTQSVGVAVSLLWKATVGQSPFCAFRCGALGVLSGYLEHSLGPVHLGGFIAWVALMLCLLGTARRWPVWPLASVPVAVELLEAAFGDFTYSGADTWATLLLELAQRPGGLSAHAVLAHDLVLTGAGYLLPAVASGVGAWLLFLSVRDSGQVPVARDPAQQVGTEK